MDSWDFVMVTRKYKKCPDCGSSWKDTKMNISLSDEIISITCECGFAKNVDKNNKEIKGNKHEGL